MQNDHSGGKQKIDLYVYGLEEPSRSAIAHLRKVVCAAAPEAEDIITYLMPGIGHNGPVVSHGAFNNRCLLFPKGESVFVGHAERAADQEKR